MTVRFPLAKRLQELPPYLFSEIDKAKRALRAKGVDLIDLGIGDPDRPTPEPIVHALAKAGADPENHRYPNYEGLVAFRQGVAKYYKDRYGVPLDAERNVLTLIGSKEGIAHFPVAFQNPGDVSLVPEPGYPVYAAATKFCGGDVCYMPLLETNHYYPDFQAIPKSSLAKARFLYLNYPNNPTGAIATKTFLETAVSFATKHDLIIVYDNAYAELVYEQSRPLSILAIEGAMDRAIEFNSLSKTFNMTGWRLGFAVGNAELIAGLLRVKTNVDSGVFQAVQIAGLAGLDLVARELPKIIALHRERRDLFIERLTRAGWQVRKQPGTFYVWAKVPEKNCKSADFVTRLLEEAHVVATPGVGFGPSGEGYVRFSLTAPTERVALAAERIAAVLEGKKPENKARSTH